MIWALPVLGSDLCRENGRSSVSNKKMGEIEAGELLEPSVSVEALLVGKERTQPVSTDMFYRVERVVDTKAQ